MPPIKQLNQYVANSQPTIEIKGGVVYDGVLVVPQPDGEPAGFPAWFSSLSRKKCAIKIDPVAQAFWIYDGADWFQLAGGSGSIDVTRFVKRGSLIGAIDNDNLVFEISEAIVPGSEELFRNGILQDEEIDYTISGSNITMTSAPEVNDGIPDTLRINYTKA